MIYYVKSNVTKDGDGSQNAPFNTISQAARIAVAGDEIVVGAGIYRESVNPANSGKEDSRIVYRAKEKGTAVITGAEEWNKWESEGGIWRAQIPNSFFTDRNPFTELVAGDWFIASYNAHLGDVFLDGKSLYEVWSKDDVINPPKNTTSWDPDFTSYVWYTEQDEKNDATVIYANFHDIDPTGANVEISVRKNCFYPDKTGISYITVSGFKICQAATQWAPPTAYQEGMVGPHWSKGWIIEDCEISESKCSGISLGKLYQPYDDNRWSKEKYKDGAQTQRDVAMSALLREGWNKNNIGSHTVRRCDIHDCGQTGIVGNLGGVFSVIEDNHIHHINNKQNLAGAEIAGIKMHAAVDVVYRRNHIHHCTRGMWLDWMAQGTRVTQSVFHDNTLPYDFLMREENQVAYGEDVWIEVSHGPTLVDNCILLSTRSVRLSAQGVAFVHNLIGGSICAVGRGTDNGAPGVASPRYTPYHVPHSTDIAGFMTFLHGDARFYNNIFVQRPFNPYLARFVETNRDSQWDDGNLTVGTWPFDPYPTYEEWNSMFEGYCGEGGERTDKYYTGLPVWSEGNAYYNGAIPWKNEKNSGISDQRAEVDIVKKPDGWYISCNIDASKEDFSSNLINTETLGKAFEPDAGFDNPDGSEIVFDTDYFGNKREGSIIPGPFASYDLIDKKLPI